MTYYPDGAAVLNDALLRANGLRARGAYAVLIVEGPTDCSVFGSWCAASAEQVVVAGDKSRALGAHRKMEPPDRGRILVIVDCDGDAGQLCGSPNLVVTAYNDLEADLMMVDELSGVVTQLLAGRVAPERLEPIRGDVVRRAVAVATEIEAIRQTAQNVGISLRGHPRDLKFKKFREPRSETIATRDALTELLRVHHATQGARALAASDVQRIERGIAGRVVTVEGCSGKVLLAAAAAVMHQDFRVRGAVVPAFDEIVRASVIADPRRREDLEVVKRVRRWEARNDVRLLAA